MNNIRGARRVLSAVCVAVLVSATLAWAGAAGADGDHSRFDQQNLLSDIAGVARVTDPNVVNPWGLAHGPTTPLWVADNGTNVATVYPTLGTRNQPPKIHPLVVSIPGGAPTGQVFNPTTAFGGAGFLFSSEAGMITAWNSGDNSAHPVFTKTGAVYKGLGLAVTAQGPLLYATDFHNGTVDVLNGTHVTFNPVDHRGPFYDPNLPKGYAPFGIQALNGSLVVTFAQQDKAKHDNVNGAGLGYIDVYDQAGRLLKRFASQDHLNAPWGVALAPGGFGRFGGALLVGNFGDGHINAFDANSGHFLGALANRDGIPIAIDGLWGLLFGNGTDASTNTLIFSAGIADESHGLVGTIDPAGN